MNSEALQVMKVKDGIADWPYMVGQLRRAEKRREEKSIFSLFHGPGGLLPLLDAHCSIASSSATSIIAFIEIIGRHSYQTFLRRYQHQSPDFKMKAQSQKTESKPKAKNPKDKRSEETKEKA